MDRVLSDTGKSLDDFRAAVELYQRRFTMNTQVNALPKLEAERKEVEQKLLKADEALEAAEQQHTETTAPLHGRLEMLRQAMQEAERSRHQLAETCPDEELREHLADLQGRHDEAHDRSFKLRQVINDCRTCAKSDRAEAAHTSSSHKEQELRALAERREAKAAECEKELADVLKLLATLEKQMQAVRAAMLEP